MKLQEVIAYNLKSEAILTESQSWEMLTEHQRLYVGSWEKNVWPLVEQYSNLMEADITPDEIQKIFTQAEKVSIEGGENLTALGKAGKVTSEVSGKMKTEINKLMDVAANSGPVKNFDAQFEKLKAQLKTKLQGNPAGQKILAGVDKWGGFAKDNPAKSAFIIGAMTSVLAFASGGILSGAAIGFFLKLANNTIKGDKLSTAVAKGVKGAALGAIAGGLGDAISGTAEDMFPAEVTNIFVNQDGAIDISQLDAMDATSLTDIDATAAKELIQARSAMEEMIPKLGAEESEVLQQQLDQLNDKINTLGAGDNLKGSIDAIQDEFGIEGRGVDVKVSANDVSTSTTAEPLPGEDGEYGEPAGDGAPDADKLSGDEVGTVKAQYGADELNDKFNIDSSEFPRNGWLDENKDALLKAGMSDQEFEDLQAATQLQRAVDQSNFREGVRISASDELNSFMGSEPQVIGGIEGEYEAGETFTSKVETKLPGTEKPWMAQVDVQIEGVDANGDIVYAIKELTVAPEIFNDKMFAAIDALAESDPDNPLVKEFMDKVIMSNSEASMDTLRDTFAQDVAEKVMQGAAAVALGGALAKSEYVEKGAKKESKVYKNAEQLEEQYFYELEDYILNEIDIKQMAKKAAAGAANIGKAAAKGAGKAVGSGLDKAGAVANKGLGKAVGAVAGTAKKAGKELGQKVTTRKLNKAWTKAGEPTDTGSITNILSAQGLSDEQIGTVATDTGQPLEKDPNASGQATDGAVDATQAPTAGDNTKATQAQATTKNDKQEPSSTTAPGETPKATGGGLVGNNAKKPKVPGGAKAGAEPTSATASQPNAIPGLAQKIKKAGVEAQVKKMLGNTGGTQQGGTQQGGTQQGGEVSLPDLATKIANAGVQKQVRAMLVRG
jgi:hypothetical protein